MKALLSVLFYFLDVFQNSFREKMPLNPLFEDCQIFFR